MCVMHDLRNSGVLCLKKKPCGECKTLQEFGDAKKNHLRQKLLREISGLIHFHGLQSVVSSISLPLFCLGPRMMVFLPLSLHACTCLPRSSLCCCNLRWRSLSEIILPMISVFVRCCIFCVGML